LSKQMLVAWSAFAAPAATRKSGLPVLKRIRDLERAEKANAPVAEGDRSLLADHNPLGRCNAFWCSEIDSDVEPREPGIEHRAGRQPRRAVGDGVVRLGEDRSRVAVEEVVEVDRDVRPRAAES